MPTLQAAQRTHVGSKHEGLAAAGGGGTADAPGFTIKWKKSALGAGFPAARLSLARGDGLFP